DSPKGTHSCDRSKRDSWSFIHRRRPWLLVPLFTSLTIRSATSDSGNGPNDGSVEVLERAGRRADRPGVHTHPVCARAHADGLGADSSLAHLVRLHHLQVLSGVPTDLTERPPHVASCRRVGDDWPRCRQPGGGDHRVPPATSGYPAQ